MVWMTEMMQARLFHAHSDFSALETVALYAALIMPLSCYKKPPGKHRTRELSRHLERRLSIWESEDLVSPFLVLSKIQTLLLVRSPT